MTMNFPVEVCSDERVFEVNEGLSLLQKKNALAFGTDAFLLAAFCRGQARARAVEFGCGNGIVSLLLAEKGKLSHITALEIQQEMADLATRNVVLNHLTDRIAVREGDVRTLTAADLGGEVEVALANPPYMRVDSGYASPHAAKQTARHEAEGGIAEFAAAAARCVKFGGVFYTVYRPDRLETLFAALRDARFAPKRMVFVHDHPEAEPSMVLTEAKRGAGEGLAILPPLVLHSKKGEAALSPRAAKIYETGEFF